MEKLLDWDYFYRMQKVTNEGTPVYTLILWSKPSQVNFSNLNDKILINDSNIKDPESATSKFNIYLNAIRIRPYSSNISTFKVLQHRAEKDWTSSPKV